MIDRGPRYDGPTDGAFTMEQIAEFNRRHDLFYGYALDARTYTNFRRLPEYTPAPLGFVKDRPTWELNEMVWEWMRRAV